MIKSPPLDLPSWYPCFDSWADKVQFCPFSPCVQERLLALKRSMSFMQDMDYTLQAAILGDEDLIADIPPPEIIPIPVESAKKSKKQPVKVMKEVIR